MASLIKYYFSPNSIKTRIKNRKISLLSFFDSKSFISPKASINKFCTMWNSSVDDYTYIGSNSSLNNVRIGKYCSISKNVNIGLAVHPIEFISTSPIFFSPQNATGYSWIENKVFDDSPKKVIIGNDVWIGINVSIMGGVTIGDGAIIGSHSLVTKNVEPYTIIGGVPAKKIRMRFNDEIISALIGYKWWNYSENEIMKKISLFNRNLNIEVCRYLINNNK